MKRTGSLKFKMTHGGCGTFVLEESGNEEILLCFSDENDTSCTRLVPYSTTGKKFESNQCSNLIFKVLENPDQYFRFDGTDGQDVNDPSEWFYIAESRYHHKRARLANYKGAPFAVGSRSPDNKHTEKLHKMGGVLSWEKLEDYPYGTIFFGAGITGYATVSTPTAVFIIGGYEHFSFQMHPLAIIAKYENDAWEKLGTKLDSKRHGHSAIWLEDEIFVIGGHQTKFVI